jgi:peptidyl-prolyl cis-trans isomerase C
VLRAPLVHFLVLGAALLGVRAWWNARRPDVARDRIVLSAADVARLRAVWEDERGAPPDGVAERTLVRDAVDEEVLWREALAAGVAERDPATRDRLAKLAEFVGEDDGTSLRRGDVVVRRHLVETMRLALARPAASDVPTDADLEAWVAAHAAELAEPPTIRLTHVYVAAATHGAATDADAARLLDELRRRGAGPEAAETRSEPFLRGAHVGPIAADALDRMFGAGFAAALADAPSRTWVGPVRSTYGAHLVWIEERAPARVPSLAEVRSRAVLGVLRERGARRAAERLAQLRARYDVEVARP